jgi:HK97 family phage prohead protease
MPNLYQKIIFDTKKVDKKESILEGVFSTSDKDRHGDIVEQAWDLMNYKKNPVILNSHRYNDALDVVGKATDIYVKDGKLQGKIKFAVKENPIAKTIFEMYAGGFLKAFSVGFMPKKFDNDGKILESELLEISAVAVPANAMALAKAKGIDVVPLIPVIKKTDFPNKDDDKEIILRNSEYPQFDYKYAQSIKENYPKIWKKGGNIRGNQAFSLWGKARAGEKTAGVTDWIREREAWMARHEKNNRIAGVVAVMKWGGIVIQGQSYMKKLINEEKAKLDEKKNLSFKKQKDKSNLSNTKISDLQKGLNIINNSLQKNFSKCCEVETRISGRAKIKGELNKTIRTLIKLKKRI